MWHHVQYEVSSDNVVCAVKSHTQWESQRVHIQRLFRKSGFQEPGSKPDCHSIVLFGMFAMFLAMLTWLLKMGISAQPHVSNAIHIIGLCCKQLLRLYKHQSHVRIIPQARSDEFVFECMGIGYVGCKYTRDWLFPSCWCQNMHMYTAHPCIYIYIYTYVCMYACMYVCMYPFYLCIYVSMYVCAYPHRHLHSQRRRHRRMHTCLHTSMHTYAYTRKHAFVHIYIDMNAYLCAYVCSCKQT